MEVKTTKTIEVSSYVCDVCKEPIDRQRRTVKTCAMCHSHFCLNGDCGEGLDCDPIDGTPMGDYYFYVCKPCFAIVSKHESIIKEENMRHEETINVIERKLREECRIAKEERERNCNP